jgi:GxxExxY protein
MVEIIFKEKPHNVVGACMEVHGGPGMGFTETVYKALEVEVRKPKIPFVREKRREIEYKGVSTHKYFADFIVYVHSSWK